MWINLETSRTYNNRLEAKVALGSAYFNKLCKDRKVIYIDEDIKLKIKNN